MKRRKHCTEYGNFTDSILAQGVIEECIPIPPNWPENRLPEEEEWEQVCLRCGELKQRTHANWHGCRNRCWICRTEGHLHKPCRFNDHIIRLHRLYATTSRDEKYCQKYIEVQRLREKARRDQGDRPMAASRAGPVPQNTFGAPSPMP